MNAVTELKFKLKTTPRRAAIEYITAIHRKTEAEGMKVLLRQVDEMQGAVRESIWHRAFNGHTLQQTCFFIELYCVAVSELSTALISLMELNTFVSCYCNFRPSPCSSLFDSMAPEYNSLQIRFSTVDLIEETYLRSWILPQHYGPLIESQLERCQLLRAWVAEDPAHASTGLYRPEKPLETEKAQMEAYISVIARRASLENVSMAATYLMHAEQEVLLNYSKHQQYAELMAIRGGYTSPPKEFRYLHNEDIRDSCIEDK
jgi:hypothetical protein